MGFVVVFIAIFVGFRPETPGVVGVKGVRVLCSRHRSSLFGAEGGLRAGVHYRCSSSRPANEQGLTTSLIVLYRD